MDHPVESEGKAGQCVERLWTAAKRTPGQVAEDPLPWHAVVSAAPFH